jgi:hypothetical protein
MGPVTPPSPSDVVADLVLLMSDRGASDAALSESQAIASLPVVGEANKSGLDAPPSQLLRDVLTAAARRLDRAQEPRARTTRPSVVAQASLGLGDWAGIRGLHHRLLALAADVGVGRSAIFAAYRRVRDDLPAVLLELQAEEIRSWTGEFGGFAFPDHNFIVSDLDVLYLMDGGIPRRSVFTRTLMATQLTINQYEVFTHYPNDQRPEAFRVKPLANCEFSARRPVSTGYHTDVLTIPDTDPGKPVTFSYEIIVRSGTEDRPYLRHFAHAPTLKATFSIQFAAEDRPSRLWQFASRPMTWDPLASVDARRGVTVNELGFAQHTFREQVPTRTFGLAWRWPDGRRPVRKARDDPPGP